MKSLSRKLALVLAVTLGASTFFAGCTAKDESSNNVPKQEQEVGDQTATNGEVTKENTAKEKVQIEFWSFWGSETRRPIIEHIVDEFNNSQDEIEVKHVYLPWGDIWTKNLAAIAAGNPPDAIVNDINAVAHRAVQNQNTNLAQFIKSDDSDLQENYFENLWETVLYDGDPYALPFNTDTRILFYNKDHFAEVGLDPEKAPSTWKELEEYAKKLDKKNGDNYERIGYYPLWGLGADVWSLNADGGVSWFDYDDSNQVAINTPAKLEALKWLNGWTDRLGRKTVDVFKAEFGNQQANPFISGKVSMWTEAATFYTQIRDYGQDLNYGIAPLPEKEEGSGHWSWGGGFVFEVPYGSKHPEEGYEFIKYATSDKEAQKYWAEKNFDNIASKEASNDSELQANEVYKAAVENMKWTVITPVPLEAPDYLSLVNPQIDAALLGQMTPEEALSQAQKDVEDLVNENK